jgi:hypothetical protein
LSVYILRQEHGDTMILDSAEGHGETGRKLIAFLASTADAVETVALGRSPLDPDMEPLRAFRMRKTDGLINTQELPDGTIEVGGRPELLARYIAAFEFEQGTESGHHHPEYAFMGQLDHRSANIIIEADEEVGSPAQHVAMTSAEPWPVPAGERPASWWARRRLPLSLAAAGGYGIAFLLLEAFPGWPGDHIGLLAPSLVFYGLGGLIWVGVANGATELACLLEKAIKPSDSDTFRRHAYVVAVIVGAAAWPLVVGGTALAAWLGSR